MTATVTPIHARRAGRAVSEGTESARRLLEPRASLTPEPLLLHRVDASQLQTPVRMVAGNVEQRSADGNACYSRPGVMCMHDARCHDHYCEGHPHHGEVPDIERDGPLLAKVLVAYAAVLGLCAWAAWQWLGR